MSIKLQRRASRLGKFVAAAPVTNNDERKPEPDPVVADFLKYDAKPADHAHQIAEYCFESFQLNKRQRGLLRLIEIYEHSLVVHDKWIKPEALVSNWICRRIEKICESFISPENTSPTQPAIIVLVGASRSRASNLIGTFYSFVDFPKLYAKTGYDVKRVYNNGNEITALEMHNCERDDLPDIEIHACSAEMSVGYSRGVCALFIDGFGELAQVPGAIDRCVTPMLGTFRSAHTQIYGISRTVCALIPVYNEESAKLATLLDRNFLDTNLHVRLAANAAEGEDVGSQSRFACRCLTQKIIDDVIMFNIKQEVEAIKRRSKAGSLRRARSATVATTQRRLPPIAEESETFGLFTGMRRTHRDASGDDSTTSSDDIEAYAPVTSPRPRSTAPQPSTREKLRATLKKVELARSQKILSRGNHPRKGNKLRAATTSPPLLPPPPSFISFQELPTALPSEKMLRESVQFNVQKMYDTQIFDSSSDDEKEDLHYEFLDDSPPPQLSRSASSSSTALADLHSKCIHI